MKFNIFHRILIFGLFLCSFSTPAQSPLDIRIALVIGNAAYTQVTRLDNPGNDAKAVAQALRGLGFTVVELLDANKAQMINALEKVRAGLQGKNGLGMLYYAGHGVQVDEHNFMVPVDMRLTRAADLPQQALDLGLVVETFKQTNTRMNILVLDACRNNPFANSTGIGRKGLAPMLAPAGTLLAYATQPGNVAEDGDGYSANGPYAQFLTAELRRPFARVEDVFMRVRMQVRKKTDGRQIPWESTSLEETFVFNDGTKHFISSDELSRIAAEAQKRQEDLSKQAALARDREQKVAAAIEKERQAQEMAAKLAEQQRLAEIAQAKEAERLEKQAREREQVRLAAEAKRREEGRLAQESEARERERQLAAALAKEQERQRAYAEALVLERELEAKRQLQIARLATELAAIQALQRLPREQQAEQLFAAEKLDWDRIRDSRNAADLYAYLEKYPNGSVSELARARLEQLAKARIQPAPDSTGQVQAFQAKRFLLGDSYQFVVSDLLTKIVNERPSFKVIAADEETAEFNQGYKVTQAGAIIRTVSGAALDPYQQWIPSGDYQIGKKWHTRSIMTLKDGRSMWVDLNGRVVARETITVPAGSFDTYKMEMEQTAQDGSRLKITYWGQPDWGVAIKQIREIRDSRGALSGQIYEMQSRQRGG